MRALNAYLNGQKIGLIDVGASGGLEPRWRRIKANIKAFLFEPDERSQKKLELADYIEKVFPIGDRKSTRLNSSHTDISRMPSSA